RRSIATSSVRQAHTSASLTKRVDVPFAATRKKKFVITPGVPVPVSHRMPTLPRQRSRDRPLWYPVLVGSQPRAAVGAGDSGPSRAERREAVGTLAARKASAGGP